MRINKLSAFAATFVMLVSLTILFPASAAPQASPAASPNFSNAVAFDVSPAARDLPPAKKGFASSAVLEVRPERGPVAKDKGFSGAAAVQVSSRTAAAAVSALAIPSPLQNFEGLSNQDNFDVFGFRVNPPDPNGDVGPNHYVEIVNLVFAVYSKTGTL